jgi:hypothetical protein
LFRRDLLFVFFTEHLYVAAQRDGGQTIFGFAALKPPKFRAKSQGEAQYHHTQPLGYEEMSQLVDEDEDA